MFQDEDGYLEVELSLDKDKFVKVEGATAKLKLKTETEFSNKLELTLSTEIDVEVEITEEKSIAFYLRFLANDNDDTFNNGDYENVFSGCMKVEFIDNRPKEVKIIVTNTKIRNGIVRSFPDDDGKTYVVPTYQMNVIGMDSKEKTNTTSFEVIRFGVEKNIETGIEPHVVGLAESQSYKLNWVDYMHGSWQVKNDWLIHKGADDQKNSHGGFRLC